MQNRNQIFNLQQYTALKEEVQCLPRTAQVSLLLDTATRLDLLNQRISTYNNLSWYKRIFKKF